MPCEIDLNPTVYQTCMLYFGQGLRIVDVAAAIGYSRRGVQKHLAAARAKYPNLRRRQYHRRDFDPFADI